MKKIILGILIFTVSFTAFLKSPLYAHDKEMEMMGKEGGEGQGMMGGKMMGMHLMMKMMMEKSVVATEDGGVVVVAGNKITKYDKDLNVVKEAEIKMDMEAMEKNMKEMMEKCPMMKGMDMGSKSGTASSSETAASSSDHEKHH